MSNLKGIKDNLWHRNSMRVKHPNWENAIKPREIFPIPPLANSRSRYPLSKHMLLRLYYLEYHWTSHYYNIPDLTHETNLCSVMQVIQREKGTVVSVKA